MRAIVGISPVSPGGRARHALETWLLSESIQTSPWLESILWQLLRSTYEREVTGSLVLSWRSMLLGRFFSLRCLCVACH